MGLLLVRSVHSISMHVVNNANDDCAAQGDNWDCDQTMDYA